MIPIVEQNKHIIILGSFFLGIISTLDMLPRSVEIASLNENVQYVYLAAILFGAYLFFKYYYQGTDSFSSSKGIVRTVASRNLSNPDHLRDIRRQRGGTYSQVPPNISSGGDSINSAPQISPDVWNKFKRD